MTAESGGLATPQGPAGPDPLGAIAEALGGRVAVGVVVAFLTVALICWCTRWRTEIVHETRYRWSWWCHEHRRTGRQLARPMTYRRHW